MYSLNPTASGPWNPLSPGSGLGRPAPRHPYRPVLRIDVLVGALSGGEETSCLPLILDGIYARAKLETLGRPELGRVRIAVHLTAADELRGREGAPRVHWRIRRGDRHGVIMVFAFEPSAVEAVARKSLAVSVLGRDVPAGLDQVEVDDAAVASLVAHLHAVGHSRIGFLAGDSSGGAIRAQRRFAGYQQGLVACGLELDWHRVLNVRENACRLGWAQTAATALRRVRKSGVTAWVCASDFAAYCLARELEAGGIRVPNDCSITGFGGQEVPDGLRPVTSLRIRHEHVGSSALTRTINRVLYPSSPQRKILIQAQFIPGETTAGPRRP